MPSSTFDIFLECVEATSQTYCIHLFSGEDALDVNPAVRLNGAVAAAHGAYPRFIGLHDARTMQGREIA